MKGQDKHVEGSAGPRMSKIWMVPLAALALANVGFTVTRIVDAVTAGRGQMPWFTLRLPMWIRPESRPAQLAVLLTMPALSILLPALMLAPGVIGFVRRCRTKARHMWPVVPLGAGFLFLAANAMLSHLPGMSEGLLYRLTCPGVYMVIPAAAVAAGIMGIVCRRREERPGAWMAASTLLGGACLIANAITTYVICHSVPSF